MPGRDRAVGEVDRHTRTVRGVNAAVMFVLELAVYAGALAWAWTLDWGAAKAVAAVLAIAVLVGVWARFGAPTAARPALGAARVGLETGWFGAGALAWLASGRATWALALAGCWAVNLALRAAYGQLPTRPPDPGVQPLP